MEDEKALPTAELIEHLNKKLFCVLYIITGYLTNLLPHQSIKIELRFE